jgi:hypothetical protein
VPQDFDEHPRSDRKRQKRDEEEIDSFDYEETEDDMMMEAAPRGDVAERGLQPRRGPSQSPRVSRRPRVGVGLIPMLFPLRIHPPLSLSSGGQSKACWQKLSFLFKKDCPPFKPLFKPIRLQ